MRYFTFILTIFLLSFQAEQQPEIVNLLKERYLIKNGFKTTVNIRLDVPGITAPEKTIEIIAENNKPMKIKGEGLVLLPKKGFVRQFTSLLNEPVHWIQIDKDNEYETWKLVSLNPKSDWVTADIKIYMPDARIDEMTVTTRDAGDYFIKYFYESANYPVRSEIEFSTDKFSIPLKFMGKSDIQEVGGPGETVKGKVYLEFSDFELL
jgi:hypothetical protein